MLKKRDILTFNRCFRNNCEIVEEIVDQLLIGRRIRDHPIFCTDLQFRTTFRFVNPYGVFDDALAIVLATSHLFWKRLIARA